MVYYEPCVTQADKDHIAHRLSKYVMDIRHDHELYRHLHCYWPDDPIGPNNCSFDVITAPGSITIYGDWMRAFTLRRYGDPDMLLDFCNTKELNISYWAEKLNMNEHAKNSTIVAISTDAFFEDVRNLIKEWYVDNEYPHNDERINLTMNNIRETVSFEDSRHPFDQLLDIPFYPDPYSYSEDMRDIIDPENTPGEHYTLEWVRTCMALQWAAQTYVAAQCYKKQKHTRRYLATQRHMTLCEHPPLIKPPVVGI